MTFKNIITTSVLVIVLMSCNSPGPKITNADDYEKYLELSDNVLLQQTMEDNDFWVQKLKKDNHQFPYNAKIAAAQSQLFNQTGKIAYLIEAEKQLEEANKKTNYKKASFLRSLARNYISQHRFREALELLKNAETNGEHLESTQKMLFDVYLELGDYAKAKQYLNTFIDFNDFNYLIRLAKWNDHKGDLKAAIIYMEKAKDLAEYSKNDYLKKWVYTNIADFYGHDGQIKKSYDFYLKSLSLNPHDAYAKKGIAWIVYSYEHNPKEALRILNSITAYYHAPSYDLLKAEIDEYMNNTDAQKQNLENYAMAVQNKDYGAMYNKYNVLLLAKKPEELDKAHNIALQEIQNRPTAQSYDLLAWTLYKKGNVKKALTTMEDFVVGNTFEPHTLYHLAVIYKANGLVEKANELKKELENNIYELGPIIEQDINQI